MASPTQWTWVWANSRETVKDREAWRAVVHGVAKWKKVKWLFVTPWTVGHQGPPSMGFSRQEYWSRVPCPPAGDLPHPGIKPRPPILQVHSLPAEPQGKPKNTGVASLCLLQKIFPTQELNQGLLHCRQILYQLSYQGSPALQRPYRYNDGIEPSHFCAPCNDFPKVLWFSFIVV